MDQRILWQTVVKRTDAALSCSALHPIETTSTTIEDGGIVFSVRCVSSLVRKDKAKERDRQNKQLGSNPFSPPEQPLIVANVSDTHIAVLNKYNVFPYHLLIVTRDYEHQQTALTAADFTALWRCLWDYPSLGFYNSGQIAGASQQHKHLQVVPLPLTQADVIPVNRVLPASYQANQLQRVSAFAFNHCFYRFSKFIAIESAISETNKIYQLMLDRLKISVAKDTNYKRLAQPYNLLINRDWMMLIPRTVETFAGISINALGYAGSFFVRRKRDIDTIRQHGPLILLRHGSGTIV